MRPLLGILITRARLTHLKVYKNMPYECVLSPGVQTMLNFLQPPICHLSKKGASSLASVIFTKLWIVWLTFLLLQYFPQTISIRPGQVINQPLLFLSLELVPTSIHSFQTLSHYGMICQRIFLCIPLLTLLKDLYCFTYNFWVHFVFSPLLVVYPLLLHKLL